MEAVQPVEGVGNEEVLDFPPPEVVDQRAPVHVPPLAGVGMLEEMGAIEGSEPLSILGKVGRDPVDDHSETLEMEGLHQRLEILGVSVARRGREEAQGLVAPAPVERVFAHRQELDMGEAHFLHIGHQLFGQLAVGEKSAVTPPSPGAQMEFEDAHGGRMAILLPALGHPGPIPPRGLLWSAQDGGRSRRILAPEGVGIRF